MKAELREPSRAVPREKRGGGAALALPRTPRIVIERVYPELDCGRFPVKREAGETFEVWADIFKEGHDKITAVLRHRRKDEAAWREVPMTLMERGLDRWRGALRLEEIGRHIYTIAAWADEFESWLDEIGKKRGAGQAIPLELSEGRHAYLYDVVGQLDPARRAFALGTWLPNATVRIERWVSSRSGPSFLLR